jgi:S-adenosylmethionine:tRNA ribosyltransferase-isomerase
LEELEFDFPEELIAQHPVEPRDSCRLLHLAAGGRVSHGRFAQLPDLLRSGDTLVFNDSRVLAARVLATKPSGGRVELLFLKPLTRPLGDSSGATRGQRAERDCGDAGEMWEALARPSHRLKPGGMLILPGGETLTLQTLLGDGRWVVEGPPEASLVELMERYGRLPLPPYIKSYPADPDRYQTVYAARLGSAAAPTAGLHFTPELLETLRARGVGRAHVTLHVGLDTFQPIREAVVEDHRIHRETYFVTAENIAILRSARARGGRLVAVGTTATRVLETLGGIGAFATGACDAPAGDTQIFITPGYRFRVVDALLTNFHLPRSSVLALVMAFAGAAPLRAAYDEAIALRYRFFSFGDAMLVEKPNMVAPSEPTARPILPAGGDSE